MRILTFIILFILTSPTWGQQEKHCFEIGEQAHYEVYYNWQFVWLNAGQVTFYTKQKTIDGEALFHFDSQGGTLPNYDWIYHVEDRYQSYARMESLDPIWSLRDIHEGKNTLYNKQQFNYTDSTIITQLTKNNVSKSFDTISFKTQTFDVLTAIYHCRNINFSELDLNDTIPIPIAIDNEKFSLYIRYLGEDEITSKTGKKYQTIKFSVLLIEGTIFTGGEDMTVWVSNDANKIPIHIEAKILVGSIKAYLSEIIGQKDRSINY